MNLIRKISFFLVLLFLHILVIPTYFPAMAQSQFSTICAITDVGKPGDTTLPAECEQSGGGGSEMANKVIELARQEIKKTYVWGAPAPRTWSNYDPDKGKAPDHYDCSGLVGWAWYWGSGGKVSMAGQTNSDWDGGGSKFQKFGPDPSKLQPGDIVYFASSSEGNDNPGHVGVYSGKGPCGKDDCFIHIFSSGKPGAEQSLSTRLKSSAYSSRAFSGFLRPVLK